MAFSRAMALIMAFAAIAGASAASLMSGNMNYGSPISNLPHLGKEEPFTVLEAGRKLLAAKSDKWNSNVVDEDESDAIFGQGVSSGDPFATSVILWTRITRPNGKGKTAAVDWAVSKTKDFKKVEKTGSAVTNGDIDFTVKVEARGLKPNTKYYYQFRFRPATKDQVRPCRKGDKKCEKRRAKKALEAVYSVIGTTRTLPRANEDIKRARIAFFGCSNLPTGFFTSYGQVAQAAERGEVDYNIHTGDYIYEYETTGSALFNEEDRVARTHNPKREIVSLQDYRDRHNQYNSDFDTKWMRRSAPFIPVWDDHEYTNDAWRDGAQNHQPATEGDWDERRLRALQVYYEQMPIRQADADNKQRIYRSFEIGSLIRLVMLDTRVIGRDQQNGTARDDPNRTLLGDAQTQYLKNQLSAAEGRQTWKVLGQQVLFLHRCEASLSIDQWDGYRANQAEVLDHITSNRIDNTIILTGDIHTHWANDIARYPCPNEPNFNYNNATGAGSVAVEFVSSSITSGYNPSEANRVTQAGRAAAIKAVNPSVKYQESFYKGFAILNVTPTEAKSTWYFAPELTRAGQYSNMVTGESWKVRAGTNRLVRA